MRVVLAYCRECARGIVCQDHRISEKWSQDHALRSLIGSNRVGKSHEVDLVEVDYEQKVAIPGRVL